VNRGEWLDANTRYVTAAVAWVRALLRERPKRAHALAAQMSELAEAMSPPPELVMLAQRLELSTFERNVLLLCAATELDTSIAPLCAQAQADASRAYPTFALALSLFDEAAWDVISPERPLRYWRLIEISQPGATPLTVSPLRADERIVNQIKGVPYLDDRLSPLLTRIPDPGDGVPDSQRASADEIVERLRFIDADRVPAIQLLGADAASKEVVAGLVCRALGRRAYRLDWRLLPAAPGELDSLARLWQRESLLLPVALYVDADAGEAAQANALEMLLLRLPGAPVFLATRHLRPVSSSAPVAVDVAKPSESEQRACWAAALGERANGVPDALAAQFDLNAATIGEIARRETADPDADVSTLRDRLWDATRAFTRPRLDTLAHRVVPRATWNDIVLPTAETALLHQIADQVRHRTTVYDRWGFARRMTRGLGISVLFAGAPGSGKTMAAEVMANELRLDLFRIDLSAVMSKYIGETEANLRKLFDAAEDGGAILLFDEADALFGKRTEVKDSHDRYANIEINYLLQRMESYGGLAVLATNMKSALDQAFLRRLRFVLDFPFPGAAERKAMWQKAFPADTPTGELDFDRLARLNVTGGHIAVIALNAAFAAARAGTPVTMPLVLDAARVEFRKLGRPINEADFREAVA
jgi:ATPase family associated with various cellular activities (AAA)